MDVSWFRLLKVLNKMNKFDLEDRLVDFSILIIERAKKEMLL